MTTLCLVVLGRSDDEISSFTATNLRHLHGVAELCLISNPDKRFGGIGTVGNRILERTLCDVFGMVHADTSFEHGALEAFTSEAARGSVAGLVGRALDGQYIWSKDAKARTAVSTLDSCSVFFPRSIGLRFDTVTFDDFHCAVEDICLLAQNQHKTPVIVPTAGAMHHGKAPTGVWAEQYWVYRQRLAEKWSALSPFQTT